MCTWEPWCIPWPWMVLSLHWVKWLTTAHIWWVPVTWNLPGGLTAGGQNSIWWDTHLRHMCITADLFHIDSSGWINNWSNKVQIRLLSQIVSQRVSLKQSVERQMDGLKRATPTTYMWIHTLNITYCILPTCWLFTVHHHNAHTVAPGFTSPRTHQYNTSPNNLF